MTEKQQQQQQQQQIFGAIVGDIAGSIYEHRNCKSETKCQIFAPGSTFTDDSVLTIATAECLISRYNNIGNNNDRIEVVDGRDPVMYTKAYQKYGRQYPYAGYGGTFSGWIHCRDPKPYHSWGNGSAMRVSPIGWVAPNLDWALTEAKYSAQVTHDHPEGIKGAQAVAAAIYLARKRKAKDEIRSYITQTFEYNLDRTVDNIRPNYKFDVSCQGSVPEAIIAFLDSNDFEDSIRKAISLGGDSDTIACITASIAQAFYNNNISTGTDQNHYDNDDKNVNNGISTWMIGYCRNRLDSSQLKVIDEFWKCYENDSWTFIDDDSKGEALEG